MTKVFALLSIAAVFAFASCGEKKPEEGTVDTAAATVVPEAAPMAEDTATTAPAGDSAKVEATPAH